MFNDKNVLLQLVLFGRKAVEVQSLFGLLLVIAPSYTLQSE